MLDLVIDILPEFVPVLSVQAVDVGAVEIEIVRYAILDFCT
jgi:hypothetical protein